MENYSAETTIEKLYILRPDYKKNTNLKIRKISDLLEIEGLPYLNESLICNFFFVKLSDDNNLHLCKLVAINQSKIDIDSKTISTHVFRVRDEIITEDELFDIFKIYRNGIYDVGDRVDELILMNFRRKVTLSEIFEKRNDPPPIRSKVTEQTVVTLDGDVPLKSGPLKKPVLPKYDHIKMTHSWEEYGRLIHEHFEALTEYIIQESNK